MTGQIWFGMHNYMSASPFYIFLAKLLIPDWRTFVINHYCSYQAQQTEDNVANKLVTATINYLLSTHHLSLTLKQIWACSPTSAPRSPGRRPAMSCDTSPGPPPPCPPEARTSWPAARPGSRSASPGRGRTPGNSWGQESTQKELLEWGKNSENLTVCVHIAF